MKEIGEIIIEKEKELCIKNNGERYEGDFRNDNREGKGIMYWNNGNIYDGEWRNDRCEGKGIYYFNKEPYKGDRYE